MNRVDMDLGTQVGSAAPKHGAQTHRNRDGGHAGAHPARERALVGHCRAVLGPVGMVLGEFVLGGLVRHGGKLGLLGD
ncbi:hypothetical protein SAMN05444004_10796 [Jannaschia faecimaris]|uniref:Uncharacterized protein n=1 Tax=Jannaschia faecimaris TaxID=1244108 RepID=A0A1H3R113_9RHOB|nr:hypothetical protein SAMN05444004_10796 [Jannaschia faecimaris]